MYLDVRQGHEVLGDVNNKLVHEGRCNVKTIHVVVQVVPKEWSNIRIIYMQPLSESRKNLHTCVCIYIYMCIYICIYSIII
jgi:hypothetical protein